MNFSASIYGLARRSLPMGGLLTIEQTCRPRMHPARVGPVSDPFDRQRYTSWSELTDRRHQGRRRSLHSLRSDPPQVDRELQPLLGPVRW